MAGHQPMLFFFDGLDRQEQSSLFSPFLVSSRFHMAAVVKSPKGVSSPTGGSDQKSSVPAIQPYSDTILYKPKQKPVYLSSKQPKKYGGDAIDKAAQWEAQLVA